ncbi:hypothetical protein N7448_011013 [Penicillium atrosanguineum]|nr:hypothetical protein N7448_011013 [Penicillium atrosanguineum]
MPIHRHIPEPVILTVVGTLLLPPTDIPTTFASASKIPGPFLAIFTNFHKFSLFWSLRINQKILSLHQKTGPSFWNAEAVALIYKSGKAVVKSSFSDGFTMFNPNLFGNRDENIHSLRQMAHSFSTSSLTDIESIFDRHVDNLRQKLDKYIVTGKKFDLKNLIAFYGYTSIHRRRTTPKIFPL